MSPGSDLKAVALPEIPEGHRWRVHRDRYGTCLEVSLEKSYVLKHWWAKDEVRWDTVDTKTIALYSKYDSKGKQDGTETLLEATIRTAENLKKKHLENLKKLLMEEALIGTYEPRQNKALP